MYNYNSNDEQLRLIENRNIRYFQKFFPIVFAIIMIILLIFCMLKFF